MKKLLSMLMLLAALLLPWASKAQETVTIGTGTTTQYTLPVNMFYNYSLTQQIYTADEIGGAGLITAVALYYDYTASFTMSGVQVYMKNVTKSAFANNTDMESVTSGDLVYTGTLSASAAGWVTINLDTPFQYDGVSNLLVCFFDQTSGYPGSSYKWRTTATTGNLGLGYYSDSYVPSLTAITSYSGSKGLYQYRNNIQITITSGTISCYPVRNLAVANTTSQSVTINWVDTSNNGALYNVYSVTPTDTLILQSGLTDTFYTISNLTPNTQYTFAVKTVCGVDDESSMRYVTTTTPCAEVAADSLPYHYGFDDATTTTAAGTFNACYGRYQEGTTTNYPYASATNHSGGKSLYMYSTASIHSWVTLPLFEEDLNELQLSFYAYRGTTATYGHYAVGVMSDPSDITTFDTLLVGQVSANSLWELVEVPLLNYTGTGTFLAILCPKGTAANYTYIDDITVDYLPSCIRPDGLTGTNQTAHSATLTWNSTASEFIVEVGPAGFVAGTGDSAIVYTNSHEVEGLVMGKLYGFYVTAVCSSDDTSTTAYGTFTTACDVLTADDLPYLETFEAYGTGAAYPINGCWAKGTNSATAYPYPYSTAAINGNRGLYLYSTRASTATGASYYSWVALPPIDESISMSDLQVEFMAKRYSSTTAAYHSMFLVGVADSIIGFTNAEAIDTLVTWIDTIDLTPAPASSIHSMEVSFADYTGTGRYVVFYAPYQNFVSGTAQNNYVYVDDINLMFIPTCFKPVSASIESVSTDEVTLSWVPDERTTNPLGWIVEYGPEGFAAGEGESESFSDTTATITNLSSATRYEFRIMADCGGYSSDARIIATTTECEALALPYYENFDGLGSLSNGDATAMTDDAPICWNTTGPSDSYLALYSSSSYLYGNSGYSLKTRSGVANKAVYMILPSFTSEISALEMSFQTRPEGTSANSGSFDVGYLTNAADTTTFVTVHHYSYSDFNGAYQEVVATFDNAPEGSRIAMRHIPTSAAWYWFVDEIEVHLGPSCSRVQGIAIDNCSDTSASLVINDSNHVDNYIITFVHGTDSTVITTTSESYTFNGLTANTPYSVTVVTDCDDGTYTAPFTIDFTTACSPMPADSLPYVEDFESYGSSATSPIDPCWTKGTNYTTAYPYPTSTAASGARSLYFYGAHSTTTAYWSYAALPAFVTPLNQLQVNFQIRRYSSITTAYPCKLSVGVMSNPNDISTFELVEEIDNGSAAASSVHEFEVSFAGYTGQGKYIAFYVPVPAMDGTTSTYNYLYLDSVVVDLLPSCYRPVNVTASNITANSMDISWTGNATSYELEYADNTDFNGSTTVVVNGTSTSVTSLMDYHAYYFRVRGICSATDTSEWSYPVKAITELDCGTNGINIVDTIGNGTSSGYTYTFYGYTSYYTSYTSHVFTAQELADLGLLSNSRINGITLHSGSTGGVINKAKIYVAETSMDEFSATPANDTVNRNTMTLVYSGDLSVPANSWVEIPFNAPFQYSGMNNLLITLARDTVTSASVTFYYTSCTPTYRTCYGYRSSATTANNTATRSYYRPNIIFNMCTEVPQCLRPTNVTVDSYSDTSATLVWDSVGTGYDVLLSTTSVDPDSAANPVIFSVTANTATLTSLLPNTTYYAYVRTNCGNFGVSEWSIEQSFTTACAPMALPYSENFEGYGTGATNTINPCWAKGTNSTTAYPYPYSTNAVNGSRSLYFYAYRPSSATTAPTYSYAALPMFQDSVQNLYLSMNVRRYSSTTASYTTRLVIGVMVNPNDITTFEPVDTIDLHDEEPLSVHGFDFYFNNYTGNGKYIAIYNGDLPFYPSQTTCYSYAYVDDIYVDYIPTCPRVNNVTISNIGSTTATVRWTASNVAGANYEVEYGERGFTVGTGTTLTATADSVVLTGLTGGIDYDVYVRAICSATDQSEWSFVQGFSTVCAPRALPMFFDPDDYATGSSAALPTCWHRINNATNTYNYYPYVYSSSTNAHTGSNTIYYYFATSSGYATDEAMVFPEIDTANYPMNTVELSFWAKRSTYDMDLLVGVMTNPTNISTFTVVDTIALTSTSTEYTVPFDSYTGYGSYVALRGVHTGSNAQYIYLDDITIGQLSPCPRAYELTVNAVTATSATLAWSDSIGSTQWVVEYGAVGDSSVTVTVNSNPVTLTGLTANTAYNYRVAPICQTGVQADWSRETHVFTTSQVPASLPYSYDFSDAAEWANWQTASNGAARWYRGTVSATDTNNMMYLSVDGGLTNSWQPATIVNALAWRDIDFGPVPGSYDVTFYYRGGGCLNGNYDGISVLIADPSVPVGAIASTGLYTPWGNISTVYAHRDTIGSTYVVHFDNVSGVKRLVIDFFQSTTSTSYSYINVPPVIDNITVSMPACERPLGLTLDDATEHTLSVHWTGADSATYVLDYRPVGTTGTDLFDTVVNTTSHTITGLPAGATYNIWVRKLCNDSTISYWSSNITASTLCDVTMLPYAQDFEAVPAVDYNVAGGELPACWDAEFNGTDSKYIPHVTGGGSYNYPHSGTNALTMTSGSGATYGNDKVAILPIFAAPVNSLTMSFWYRHESATSGTLTVGYVTDPNDLMGSFVPVRSMPATTTITLDSVSFASAPDSAHRIGFRWEHNSTFYSVGIDDITVTSTFNCFAPIVTLSNPTYEAVTVTAAGVGETFELSYGTDPSNLGNTMTSVTGQFDITGLTPSTQYFYAVRQQCDTNLWSTPAEGFFVTDSLPCMPVTGLNVVSVDYEEVTLNWTAEGNETSWEVMVYNTVDTFTYVASDSTYTATGLTPGFSYNANVRPLCGAAGDFPGDWSESPVSFTTKTCQPVTDVTVVEVTDTTATIVWTAATEGTGSYRVEYGPNGMAQGQGTSVTATTNSYTIEGLEPDLSYDVYVANICSDNLVSGWSSVTTFQTTNTGGGGDDQGIAAVDAEGNFNIYPNPASSMVTLTVAEIFSGAEVTIVDLNGRTVMTFSLQGTTATFDVSQLSQGAYFVRLTGEQATTVRKLIVK